MRELEMNEIEMVSGGRGFLRGLAGWVAGEVASAVVGSTLEGEVNDTTFSNPNNFQNVFGA